MGHDERGWKGEVGAYVYSSRHSKVVKAYPVRDATTVSAVETLKKYCNSILPFLGAKIDCIQTDAGTQFNTTEWKEICTKNNMMHRTCPVDHQAMNGQVERVIGLLAAKTGALLMDKGVDQKYWPLALEVASYLLNRMPHESLGGLSPLQKSTGQKPDLSRMRVLGCRAYVQVPKIQRKGKLSNTAWQGIMLGYSTHSAEWIVLYPRTEKLRYTYSVTFDESKSGFEPENVFSPVAELPTVRSFIAIAAKEKQVILQADFPNAYVNAEIKEEIYACQPKGLENGASENYVCKLKKALYGCPISGKRWNEMLTGAIIALGYKQSVIDHCLFCREKNDAKDLL